MSQGPVKKADDIAANPIAAGQGAEYQLLIGPDDGADNFALRRFTMTSGGGMPLHTNKVEHEQYVLGGAADITIDGTVHKVEAGDVVYIPAEVPHSYSVTSEEPFQFLCIVPNLPDEVSIIEPEKGQ